jgi:hypothetical protein
MLRRRTRGRGTISILNNQDSSTVRSLMEVNPSGKIGWEFNGASMYFETCLFSQSRASFNYTPVVCWQRLSYPRVSTYFPLYSINTLQNLISFGLDGCGRPDVPKGLVFSLQHHRHSSKPQSLFQEQQTVRCARQQTKPSAPAVRFAGPRRPDLLSQDRLDRTSSCRARRIRPTSSSLLKELLADSLGMKTSSLAAVRSKARRNSRLLTVEDHIH